jgi:fatty acid synthase subunit alpha, fungi type
MKAIFPESIDGNLLKLVHLSNGFRMIEGVEPLKAGDVCTARARIVSVTNSDAGKTVKVRGHVLRAGKPVIEVTSAFLYRGRFTDFAETFELVEEPDYIVPIDTDADVGVLQSKEWFGWDDKNKPLQPGTKLIFRVRSELAYKTKSSYSSISVLGKIFIRDQLKRLVKVGSVEHEQEDVVGNSVVGYIQRHGTPEGQASPLSNGGYSLTAPNSATFIAPVTNEPYSKISGDFNPIHVNPYFSDFASLPGTITHGMWSSAATRRFVETVVGQGRPERVHSYVISLFRFYLQSLIAVIATRSILSVWSSLATSSPSTSSTLACATVTLSSKSKP